MTYEIRPSVGIQFTKAPAIAIAGPSGCGKTESAMRLARGFVGAGEKFCIIDTEEKRALYKNARYQPWDWMDFQPPFTPENYVAALESAKGYRAVILDSGSHEYSGPGGLQDIQAETLHRMSKGDESKADKLSGPAWKDAKMRHKTKLMSYLIRYPTLLIVCLRAEPKVKFIKEKFTRGDGSIGEKNTIVDAGYQPICEKQFMYEMLVGCQMDPSKAGVPQHIKQLEPELEPVFLAGEQIDEQTGVRLAAWCAGRAGKIDDPATDVVYITDRQAADLEVLCMDSGIAVKRLCEKANVSALDRIREPDLARAKAWIDAQIASRKTAAQTEAHA